MKLLNLISLLRISIKNCILYSVNAVTKRLYIRYCYEALWINDRWIITDGVMIHWRQFECCMLSVDQQAEVTLTIFFGRWSNVCWFLRQGMFTCYCFAAIGVLIDRKRYRKYIEFITCYWFIKNWYWNMIWHGMVATRRYHRAL